jgi:hypothetical protein
MEPLNSNEFQFKHNGINYTVRMLELNELPMWFNRDPIEHALQSCDFAEARELIAKVKKPK